MDDSGVAIVVMFLLMILTLAGVKAQTTYPTTIVGKVIQVEYSNTPPYPCTTITFTRLGEKSNSIILAGTTPLDIKIGSSYRITYHTPFFYLYAVMTDCALVS